MWNRTPDKVQQLQDELGTKIAASPEDMAHACELIILSVSADEDVLSVIEALMSGLKPGSMVLDTSTVSRETAQRAAERLASVDVSFLDLPKASQQQMIGLRFQKVAGRHAEAIGQHVA